MRLRYQKLTLQIAVVIGGLVPVLAGGAGVLFGANMLNGVSTGAMDSHYRYLSGLLLAIGLAFWLSVPQIERYTARFRLLGLIVFIGGLARLLGVVMQGWPSVGMCFGLVMELIITPLLCFWQNRLAKTVL